MMKKLLVFVVLVLVLGLGFSACSNDSNASQPVEIVSVNSVSPPNPGGPTVKITLKNVGREPIASLVATLKLEGEKTFKFDFPDVSFSSPLQPGDSVSQTLNLIGPTGYSDEDFYPLTIIVTLPSRDIFTYTKQVKIS